MEENTSSNKFEFQIDLKLINLIRTFQHEEHKFETGFLEKIYYLLSQYQGHEAQQFDGFSQEKNGVALNDIILSVHFRLAAIGNLEDLIPKLSESTDFQVSPINIKQINSTNILSIFALSEMKEQIDHEVLNKIQETLKPQYLPNLTIKIQESSLETYTVSPSKSPLENSQDSDIQDAETHQEQTQKIQEGQIKVQEIAEKAEEKAEEKIEEKIEEKQPKKKTEITKKPEEKVENITQEIGNFVLDLNYELMKVAIQSKGKLDLWESCYVASKLNQHYKLHLHHIFFNFLNDKVKYVNYTKNYSKQFVDIGRDCFNVQFDKQIYQEYRRKLINCRIKEDMSEQEYKQMKKDTANLIQQIQNMVQIFIICRNTKQQHYIEKLLIGMLGHPMIEVRDYAVVSLNVIYDGIDWQLNAPFTVKVCNVHRKFQINYLLECKDDDDIYIQLKSNIFIPNCKSSISTIHKPKIREYKVINDRRFATLELDLGRFTRCGFYDWRVVKLGENQISNVYKFTNSQNVLFEEVKGRIVVHPKITRSLQIHEVFVDLQNGVQDESTGKLQKRGNFKTVTEALPEYKQRGVNCIYLMGALDRDNGFSIQKEDFQISYSIKRPDASPLAIVARDRPNQMMGGHEGFQELTRRAKELDVNIMVDCLTRVSSSRMDKKYKKYILQSLDDQGKLINVFGTDGRAVHFEDTSLLNYRKKKCWDLFLEEIVTFTDKYGTSGIHLDNGQSWPQILRLDEEEMYRIEFNGDQSYTEKEIFEGKIVEQIDEESGYWGSNAKEHMPNPFLIKLCRHLWSLFPNQLILSEVWGQLGGFEEAREFSVIKSGPIPRLFKMPVAISQFFGNDLRKDGSIHKLKEPKNVSFFKKWYEQSIENLPEGAMVVQSTTYHTFPYPALLFKRGTWAAVDLFFLLGDIPMTFIGEKEGKASKIKATNFFATLKVQNDKIKNLAKIFNQGNNSSNNQNTTLNGNDSMIFDETVNSTSPKSSTSQQSFGFVSTVTSNFNNQAKNKYQQADSSLFDSARHFHSQTQSQKQKGLGSKNGSYVQLTDLTKQNVDELKVISDEGWGFIESLKDIKFHYEHRRKLRESKKPLTRGKFVPLTCEHQFDALSIHSHVLTFARYMKTEIAIIGINFNDGPIAGKINFSNLQKYFPNFNTSNVVLELDHWIRPNLNTKSNHYFVSELLNSRYEIKLDGFESEVFGLKIYENDAEKIKLATQHSYERLLENMAREVPHEIEANEIAMRLYKLVKNTDSLQEFVNGFSDLYSKYYRNVNISELISVIKPFKDDNIAKNKLYAFFRVMIQKEGKVENFSQKIEFYPVIKKLYQGNSLGPICIATPEYGKFTKTGGLGVMTDELSRGLADLGEEVYVITPWYEDKQKKNPDLLKNEGVLYQNNVDIWIGGEKYEIGVFYGVVKGVHLYFLANHILFPSAFCGEGANYITKQLVAYARCVLQILCNIKVIPSIMVTNDWFSGFIPAYIRKQSYGPIFQGTKVFHIAHNLDETYEGRIYPKVGEDYLQWLHELDYDWLVDKTWEKTIINPSRCAFLTCDNWGTVSHSYKYELLQKSPLRFILESKPNAFSFPNGLNIQERLQFLIDSTGNDHLKAKEALQKKYFNFKQLDNSIPLFGFVGRITEQKGVHLIVDGLHQLIKDTRGQIQIIVGGMASDKEAYSRTCAIGMRRLRQQYPHNFWADPDLFFRDGPVLNSGCDFGLMPSKFEPGGIVQHEFFIASTPVVATKTGGLQDTVYEYNTETQKGTGFNFQEHTWFHMCQAIKRAIKVYKDPVHYNQLRKNAFEGTIDVTDVSRAYAIEFYRMYNKNFIDKDLLENLEKKMDISFDIEKFKPKNCIVKEKGHVYNKTRLRYLNYDKLINQEISEHSQKSYKFTFKPPKGTFPRTVQVVGSFNDWSKTYDLKYDQFSREWNLSIKLKPDDYMYKYKVDDTWMVNPDEPQDQDQFMNINNVIRYDYFENNSEQINLAMIKKQSSN